VLEIKGTQAGHRSPKTEH